MLCAKSATAKQFWRRICQSIFAMSPLFPLENVRMFYSCGSGKEVENVKSL